jgi:hypothetical protein
MLEIFNRQSRRSLLIEINPYQILAAGISRPDKEGAVILDCAAEFDSDDDAGLRTWLDTHFDKQRAWVPVFCGFAPPEALLQRESIQTHKLADADYLHTLVREQYKVEHPDTWKLSTLSPLEGAALAPERTQRPALICGVSHTDIHRVQQRLLDHRLLPYRLEVGILPLLGAISDYKARRNDKRAIVVVTIEEEHTTAYILGKEGVHTPAAVRHGFDSIVQAARKEFDLADAAAVRDRLHLADEELLLRATRFVRAIGRDLKPLVDSYEMTTGQPVGEIYCAYLPPDLAWIAEPLAQVVGRTPFAMDCAAWMLTVNLQAEVEVPAFGPHWLGALSLIAELPGPKPESTPRESDTYQGPWHLDCRLSSQLPSNDLVRRRFLANVIAVTLAACALVVTFWQLYLGRALVTDTNYWLQRVADNRRLVAELDHDTRSVATKSDRLDFAYALMGSRYQVSDLLFSLGRSRPANMRIDAIDITEIGMTLRGALREPSEQASRTLRGYVEGLRRNPEIGPLFASIALTALDRQDGIEDLTFEVTFKVTKTPAKP